MSIGIIKIILITAGISSFINLVMLIYLRSKKEFLDLDKNEKFHAIHEEPVPRIGGVGIFISFLLVILYIGNITLLKFLLPAILVFGLGFIEDLRKNIPPKFRLMFLFIISAFTILLLDIKVNTIGFLKLPLFIAIPLTLIAIVGFTNAINIVDGLNGLAAGISGTFLFFLGLIFYKYGYFNFALICFSIIGGVLGFLVFNFPNGKIFLGDGGAYFLGFMCAILSIKLLNYISGISPWFPFMLGIYPVWEVLFSAYRRRKKGRHPFSPDKLHFHTLLFLRLTKSNPKAAVLILIGNLVFSVVAFEFRTCTICLVFEFFLFVLAYLLVYKKILMITSKGAY